MLGLKIPALPARGEVKGLILSVTIMSPAKKLSIEETKMFLDKAIARFH